MHKDKSGSWGRVRVQVKDKDGNITHDTGFLNNVSTNGGLAVISGLAGNTGSQTAFTYLATGSGTTAEDASQTTLVTEITDSGLQRAAATVSRETTTQTNDTLQLVKTFSVTGSKTVAEIGVFNAASSGVMGYRKKLTSGLPLISGNSLVVTYKITFS